MIKEIRTIKYEALDGKQYDTIEAAMQASIAFKVEATHENWCNGDHDHDRDHDPVQFVVENVGSLKLALAPELEEALAALVKYQEELGQIDPTLGTAELIELKASTFDELVTILNGEP
jgi:hypothetical protein